MSRLGAPEQGKEEWGVMSDGGAILSRSKRHSTVTFGQRPEGSEEEIHLDIREKNDLSGSRRGSEMD